MDDSSSSSSPSSDHDHWSINTDNRLSRDHLESASADNLELHALNSCGEVSQNVNSSAELNRTYSQQDATKHITFRVLEVVFLSVIILILLALYLIPTFLFIYPPLDFTQFEQLFSSLVDFNGCAVQLPYTGQVCRQELSFMLSSEQDVHNISATNQEALERYGRTFFRELSSLDPSPECVVAIRLFVCLHYFQACDDSMAVLATETVCRDVRDRICVREWMEIDGFLGFSILPICEELPEGNSDFGKILHRDSIPISEFPSAVKRMQGSYALMEEFFEIEVPMDVSQHSGNLPCNQYKNRYYNVLPYDHSRVVLPVQDKTPGSDYINACHMNRDYIASQGPLPNTFEDFWRMVWEFNVHVIAMVTKLSDEHSIHMKCHRYWPKKENLKFGDIEIALKEMKSFGYCEFRTLEVTKLAKESTATRTVCHFQFLSWPEYGVPKRPTDLVDFRNKVHDYHSKVDGPLLVHCSAGVGRTGTFLCIDILLKRIKEGEKNIDIFNLIRQLRFRRERTVETPEQYMLIHEALAEVIASQ